MADSAPAPVVAASANEAAVGAVLDDLRGWRFRWLPPILLGSIMLFDSWDAIGIAYVMPTMSIEWKLNPLTMGFIISSGYFGQFIGAMTLGALAERFGRIPVFLNAVVVMCVLAIGCAIAPDYRTMMVLRFMQGIAIGGALPIAVTYINELAPTKIRGRYFGLFQVLAMAGFGACSLSSTFIVPNLGWRWLLAAGVLPIVLVPVVMAMLPESPRWLARIGKLAQANKALQKIGGTPVSFSDHAARPSDAQSRGRPLTTAILFNSTYRSRTITITLLWFLTMFAGFGVTTWAPSIYTKVYHIPLQSALLFAAASSMFFLISTPIVGFLMDHLGRRPFSMGGALVGVIMLSSVAIFQPTAEHVVVPMIMLGHLGVSIATLVLWPFTAETYPSDVRALGLGYASSVGRGSAIFTPVIVGLVLNKGAPISIVFALYATCALVVFVAWLLRTKETARKALHTI
jgi:putative MFS transporter